MPATSSAVGTPRARALSAALREARLASGTGLRELGRMLSISHTDLSLWENAYRVPNVEVVAMILAALRVRPEERERILELARNAGESNWLAVGDSGVQQLAGVIESGRAASAIIEWAPHLVPGLLQSPDYARAVISHSGRLADIEPRLLIRMGRQEILLRDRPVPFLALISAEVLHDPVVAAPLMRDQLLHLARMSDRPNVEIRVVPSRIGWHPGTGGSFVLYEFPDSTPVVYLENLYAGAFVPDADRVKDHRSAVGVLKSLAHGPDESRALLGEIAEEWRNQS